MTKSHCIFVFATALIMSIGAKASAQEWEYTIGPGEDSPRIYEAKPLPNGNIAVTYNTLSPSSLIGSAHPGLLLLSTDGEELARNSLFKPAFWGYQPYALSDEEGTTYVLAAYNPDHDSVSSNYFMNFDNPPDYSILGLYKLDEQLSIVENHEFQIPIDTTETPHSNFAFGSFNNYCGNIYVFSVFVDDGTVVGGYIKKPTFDYYHPHGNDSIFFFRLGFDGTLVHHVGYEMDKRTEPGGGGLNWSGVLFGYNIVKAGNSYYCFLNGYPINGYGKQIGTDKNLYPGYAYHLDSVFNIVDVKRYHQRDGLVENHFFHAAYIRSRHNSVYLSCEYSPIASAGYTGCALYEYGLDANKAGTLPILRYTERKKDPYSFDNIAARKGVAIASDNSVYFAYAFEYGRDGMIIERLSPDFDTLSTVFCEFNSLYNSILAIELTETDDVLLTFDSMNTDTLWTRNVAKFPAEAFWSIEEAHDNGLKTAVAYPNPGSNTFNICTSLPDARVEVFDATGRLIHRQEIKESNTTINVENWPSGLYVWKVYSSDNEAEIGKWVKE